MKRKNIFHIFLFATLIIGFQGKAQESSTLYFLETVPQSNLLNPALAPRCNGYFGVPGINAIYMKFQTNVSQKHFLQTTDSGTVSLLSRHFDYDKFYKKVGKGISFKNYTLISPFAIGFRGNKGYYTFSISEKIKSNSFFPTDFFSILDKGISDGSSFDFKGLGINTQFYQEFAFGYSRELISNLRVGARFKILQGFYSVKSSIKTFDLNTTTNLWTFDIEGDMYTSAPLKIIESEEGFIDSIKTNDEYSDKSEVEMILDNLTDFSNRGMAIDIGARYDLNQYWSFSASLIDLGYIRWRKNLNSFHFESEYEYSHPEINIEDSLNNAFDQILDSVNYFNAQLGNEKYSTGLGTDLYLGGQFHLNHYLSFGLLSHSRFEKNFFHQEFNLSANLNLYRIITTNLNYNIAFSGEQYAGFGLALKILPIQFYLMLDNIPIVYTNYVIDDNERIPAPYDLRSFNFMIGFNLIFGAKGFQDRPKIDAYSEF